MNLSGWPSEQSRSNGGQGGIAPQKLAFWSKMPPPPSRQEPKMLFFILLSEKYVKMNKIEVLVA